MCWESNIRKKEEGAVELGEAMHGKHVGDGVGWFSCAMWGKAWGPEEKGLITRTLLIMGNAQPSGMKQQWLC